MAVTSMISQNRDKCGGIWLGQSAYQKRDLLKTVNEIVYIRNIWFYHYGFYEDHEAQKPS